MALWPFVLNGSSYDLPQFDLLAYLTGIPNSMSDLAAHANRPYNDSSGSSITISTGSKSLTGFSGLNLRIGDYVLLYLSAGNWCSGSITAYSASTGTMTVNVDKAVGSGTGTVAIVKMGESTLSNTVLEPLDHVLGGTGAGGNFSGGRANTPGTQYGSSFGGVGASAWDAMIEVFEEFFSFAKPSSARSPVDQPIDWLASPYFSDNAKFIEKPIGVNQASPNIYGGAISFKRSNTLLNSAVVKYGQSGFLHCGGGTLHFECLASVVTDLNIGSTNVQESNFRWGLRAHNSGSSSSIFSYGGIGFERLSTNNRKLNVVIGKSGAIYRQVIPVTMNDDDYTRLGFIVSADANKIDFYVNGGLVLSLFQQCPDSTIGNLLHPAFEVQSTGGNNEPAMEIEAFWLRKNLQR